MKHPPPRRCGVVAAVVALVLLACLQIQYHHLKVLFPLSTRFVHSLLTPGMHCMTLHYQQVDLGKAGFASATTKHNRWPTRKIATGTRGLPRGILQPHSDMDLRPLYSAPATHNKVTILYPTMKTSCIACLLFTLVSGTLQNY
jgi:hypothetical protein